MKKKILSLILVCVVLFSLNVAVYAASLENDSGSNSYNDIIIQQAVELDASLSLQDQEFTVVSCGDNNTTYSTGGESNQVIQSISTTDGVVEVITILPYKTSTNNGLISSFDYEPSVMARNNDYENSFVDTIVTFKIYFEHDFCWDTVMHFYRPLGIQASWNSSNSTVDVSNMYVLYDSYGELYSYPKCMSEEFSDARIAWDYQKTIELDVDDPPIREIRVVSDMLPENQRLHFSDGFNHGGVANVRLTYSVNGVSYVHEDYNDAYPVNG